MPLLFVNLARVLDQGFEPQHRAELVPARVARVRYVGTEPRGARRVCEPRGVVSLYCLRAVPLWRPGLTRRNDGQESGPLLASLYGASVRQRVATGPRRGQRVERLGDRIDVEDVAISQGTRCSSVAGVNLHANVCVPANDRRRLERLCRYVARPPIATERLEQRSDGRLLYRLKHRWRDGTTHMVFTPMELMEKVAS